MNWSSRNCHGAAPADLATAVARTGELHAAGDWRAVFEQGTGMSGMKVKTESSIGGPDTCTAILQES